jgi:hypothetical protein
MLTNMSSTQGMEMLVKKLGDSESNAAFLEKFTVKGQ